MHRVVEEQVDPVARRSSYGCRARSTCCGVCRAQGEAGPVPGGVRGRADPQPYAVAVGDLEFPQLRAVTASPAAASSRPPGRRWPPRTGRPAPPAGCRDRTRRGPVPNQLASVRRPGRSSRTPTRGQVQSQPGDGVTSTRSAEARRSATSGSRRRRTGRCWPPTPATAPRAGPPAAGPRAPGAPAGPARAPASALPTRPRRPLAAGVLRARPARTSHALSLRSLSVGARHSSSRGPSTASPYRVRSRRSGVEGRRPEGDRSSSRDRRRSARGQAGRAGVAARSLSANCPGPRRARRAPRARRRPARRGRSARSRPPRRPAAARPAGPG